MTASSFSLSKTLVWILLALLIVGLAGFGATNLGGRINKIGKVGDTEISTSQYMQALQNELRIASQQLGQKLSMQQAQTFGLQERALSRLITEKSLENEIQRLGISVGDEVVRDELLSIETFHGVDGQFDRETYKFLLDNIGLNETEFEDQLRREIARNILKTAITKGNEAPDIYLEKLMSYITEKRSFSILALSRNDLKIQPSTPTDAEIKNFYEENIKTFYKPASKVITYVKLTPNMFSNQIEIQEKEIQEKYERHLSDYRKPELRSVERLNFLDLEEAKKAFNSIKSGETDFESLVSARGLNLKDIEQREVTKKSLGVAGESVFSLNIGEISEPVFHELGPAIFRLKNVTKEQIVTIEEATLELKKQLQLDRAISIIDGKRSQIDDLLAAGATLEDLGNETDLTIGTITYNESIKNGIAKYEKFRIAAEAVTKSDFPEIKNLSDGGIFAIRLDKFLDEYPEKLENVEDKVTKKLLAEKIMELLENRADEIQEQVQAGKSLKDLGANFTKVSSIIRDDNIADMPPELVRFGFELKLNELAPFKGENNIYLIKLNEVEQGDTSTDEAKLIRQVLKQQIDHSLSQDIFQIFLSEIQKLSGVSLDEKALNAVHNSFQ